MRVLIEPESQRNGPHVQTNWDHGAGNSCRAVRFGIPLRKLPFIRKMVGKSPDHHSLKFVFTLFRNEIAARIARLDGQLAKLGYPGANWNTQRNGPHALRRNI